MRKRKEEKGKEGKKMAFNWKLICLEINIDLSFLVIVEGYNCFRQLCFCNVSVVILCDFYAIK